MNKTALTDILSNLSGTITSRITLSGTSFALLMPKIKVQRLKATF